MSDHTNNSTDGFRPTAAGKKKSGGVTQKAIGIGMLFVVASIAFSSYMVYFGSDNMVAKIMIAPQVLFAAGVLIYAFAFKK